MLDQGVYDETILAYATGNPRYSGIESYEEIPPHILREISHFFSIYEDLEGKHTKAIGWKDRSSAHQMIADCNQRFRERHSALEGEREQSYSKV